MSRSEAGTCECGSVGYKLTGAGAVHVCACHCLNCQTRSGSAFAEHSMLRADEFACEGPTVTHTRTADGIDSEEVFCGLCHTRLYNANSVLPDRVFLRAEALKNSQVLEPILHVRIRRKQAWIRLPDGFPRARSLRRRSSSARTYSERSSLGPPGSDTPREMDPADAPRGPARAPALGANVAAHQVACGRDGAASGRLEVAGR